MQPMAVTIMVFKGMGEGKRYREGRDKRREREEMGKKEKRLRNIYEKLVTHMRPRRVGGGG